MEIAEAIARQAPLNVQATLHSARLVRMNGEAAAVKQLLPDLMPLMKNRDVQEGLNAFIEWREASFTGE